MDVVLERLQLEDDVRRDHVWPGRKELAELHEGRAELVEHLPKSLAARRSLTARLDLTLTPRDDVDEPIGLEEVSEAVLRRDLRDLGETAELPNGRPRAHGSNLTVGGRSDRAWAGGCTSFCLAPGRRGPAFEEPETMLDLGQPQLELLPLPPVTSPSSRESPEIVEPARSLKRMASPRHLCVSPSTTSRASSAGHPAALA